MINNQESGIRIPNRSTGWKGRGYASGSTENFLDNHRESIIINDGTTIMIDPTVPFDR